MQMGPSALEPYQTEQGALDFFADDNIDKSQFSLLELLRVASGNTELARSLIDLRYSPEVHSTLSPPGILYLNAPRLAVLAENEVIANEIINDHNLQNILLMRTGYENAAGEIEKEVKYLMQVASRHESVKRRILNSRDFLQGLNAAQLVECAKAIKEIVEIIEKEPALFEKLGLDDWVDIASSNEVLAQRLLLTEDVQQLDEDRLVKLSKAGPQIRSDILKTYFSRFKKQHFVQMAQTERQGRQVLTHWRQEMTSGELIQLSTIIRSQVLSEFADRLNLTHYVEIARGNEPLSQEILDRWGDQLEGSDLDCLAENPSIALRIAADENYMKKLSDYYYYQREQSVPAVVREKVSLSLDNKPIGFSQKIDIGRGVLYDEIKKSAGIILQAETQKRQHDVLEELNRLLSEQPSTSEEPPQQQANRLTAWVWEQLPSPFLQEGEEKIAKEGEPRATCPKEKARPQ